MYMYRYIQSDILRLYLLWPWNKVEVHQWLSLLPAKQVVNDEIQDEKYYNFTKIQPKTAVTVSTIQCMNRLFTLCFLINLSRSYFDYFQITFYAIMHKVFVFTHPMSLMYFWKSLYTGHNHR